jgi:hypothetical protein
MRVVGDSQLLKKRIKKRVSRESIREKVVEQRVNMRGKWYKESKKSLSSSPSLAGSILSPLPALKVGFTLGKYLSNNDPLQLNSSRATLLCRSMLDSCGGKRESGSKPQ